MNPAKITGQQRGRDFEDHVAELLEHLRLAHPAAIEVSRHPKLALHNGAEVVPDFELVYRLPFQVNRILIECQDRERGSQEIVRKISYIKSHSPRNRVIFLYKEPSLLSDPLKAALEADGILHYSLAEFVAMLFKLCNTLELTTWLQTSSNDILSYCPEVNHLCRRFVSARIFLRLLWWDGYVKLWYIRSKSDSLEESQKLIFMPRSVAFLRRVSEPRASGVVWERISPTR